MNKNNPLVSIIMNCFNGEKYLKESLTSIINQSYTNWELIFWDNKSTDQSSQIIKKTIGFIYKVVFFCNFHCESGPADRSGRFTLCVCPVPSLMLHENPKKLASLLGNNDFPKCSSSLTNLSWKP